MAREKQGETMAALVVGVTGFAGSGKDTFADYLVEHYGFTKISLSYPLKKVCGEIFDFTEQQLWGSSKHREIPDERYVFSGKCPSCHSKCRSREESRDWYCFSCDTSYGQYITPRLALQTLGTEWGRTLFEDIWVDMTLREIQKSGSGRWVIPDVRFHNELNKLRTHGTHLVRLLRGEQRFAHPSEAEMATMTPDMFDAVLDNTSTIDVLHKLADGVMENLGCKYE